MDSGETIGNDKISFLIACVESDQCQKCQTILYQLFLRIKKSCFRFSIFKFKLKLEDQFLIINFRSQNEKRKSRIVKNLNMCLKK